MSDLNSYKLGPIATHLTDSSQRVYLHWLGDSQSTATTTPRWSQGITKQWDVDWRRRILFKDGSVTVSVGAEGWLTAGTMAAQVTQGNTLTDGVTTVPDGFDAGEEHYTSNVSNFIPFYRMRTRGYDDAIGGNWIVNQPITFTAAMLRSNSVPNIRAVLRADASVIQTAQLINLNTELAAGSAWQGYDFTFNANASINNDLEIYLDNANQDETGKSVVIGSIAVGVTGKTNGFCLSFDAEGGWSTTDHIPTADGGERTDMGQDWFDARFGDVYEYPTVIAIQLGQNMSTGEGNTESGWATYKANVLKIIDAYNAYYDSAGQTRPYFMLVGNWETSAGNGLWDNYTDQLKDICDERSKCGMLNMFALVNDTHGTYATWNGTYLADGIHQNATGVEEFAALAWNEMLQQAGGTLLQRHHYFLGLGAGIGLS